jgi:hypothetical protein
VQFPIEPFFPSETLPLLYTFLSVCILVSHIPPESPIELCLYHSRLPLSHISKLFQISTTNQFQSLPNHEIRNSHNKDPLLVPSPGLSAIHCCDKVTERNNLKEERFILAHTFRGFSPRLAESSALGRTSWRWDCVAEDACVVTGSREPKEGVRDHTYPSKTYPQ